jgi:hypothetical protein
MLMTDVKEILPDTHGDDLRSIMLCTGIFYQIYIKIKSAISAYDDHFTVVSLSEWTQVTLWNKYRCLFRSDCICSEKGFSWV